MGNATRYISPGSNPLSSQPFLYIHFQIDCHLVKSICQFTNLILALDRDPMIEIT